GLAGIAGVDALGGTGPLVVGSTAPDHQIWPAATGVTLAGTAAPAAAPAGTPGASAAPTSATGPGSPPAAGFYAVGGGPGREGSAPTARSEDAAAISAAAVAPAAKAPAAGDQARSKRTAKARQYARKFRFEYLDADVSASERDSGTIGFAGTVPKSAARQAHGLTRLHAGEFGEAPHEPMLPNSWDPGD